MVIVKENEKERIIRDIIIVIFFSDFAEDKGKIAPKFIVPKTY